MFNAYEPGKWIFCVLQFFRHCEGAFSNERRHIKNFLRGRIFIVVVLVEQFQNITVFQIAADPAFGSGFGAHPSYRSVANKLQFYAVIPLDVGGK